MFKNSSHNSSSNKLFLLFLLIELLDPGIASERVVNQRPQPLHLHLLLLRPLLLVLLLDPAPLVSALTKIETCRSCRQFFFLHLLNLICVDCFLKQAQAVCFFFFNHTCYNFQNSERIKRWNAFYLY